MVLFFRPSYHLQENKAWSLWQGMLLAHPSYATCPMKVQHISCSDGSRLSGRSSLVAPSPQPTQGGGDGVSSHHRAFVLRGYPRMPRSHPSPTAKPRVTPLYHYCSNFLFQLNSPVGLGERERERERLQLEQSCVSAAPWPRNMIGTLAAGGTSPRKSPHPSYQ